ncbi:uncharacterized protein [Mytilus edulis]|uniref:uncharacterized protein n=1 Tax=Mytilus edulis TaxID=6550 RepID=UPI0039F060D4
MENKSVDEVVEWMLSKGISKDNSDVFKDNEVDGFTLIHLEEKDIFSMLPGKIGPAREIITLLKQMKETNRTCDSKISNESEQVQVNKTHLLKPQIDEEELPSLKKTTESQYTCMLQSNSSGIAEIPNDECDTIIVLDHGSSESGTFQIEVSQPKSKESETTVPSCQITKPLELYVPSFSSSIKHLLETGKIQSEWDKFIEETAYHVQSVGGMISRGTYQDFGRLMCKRYPCVAQKMMKEPWGYFNKKLSQKMRNIRWKWNIRSKMPSDSEPRAKKSKTHKEYVDLNDLSEMKAEEALLTLKDQLKKATKEQDKALIFKAQRSSFKERRVVIETISSGIKEICLQFPILSKVDYIEKEFFLMRSTVDKKEMASNWDHVLSKLDKIFDATKIDERSAEEIIVCLEMLQEEIKNSGKCKALKPLITRCQTSDQQLNTKKEEAPRLIVLQNENRTVSNCFVVGDGIQVEVGDNVLTSLNCLLYCYYVWDLSYPKQYQLLGFIQHVILNDKANKFYMSSNYLRFTKKIDEITL